MKESAYQQYIEYSQKGLKEQARKALHEFIGSFESDEERLRWTTVNLPKIKKNHSMRIRQELFEKVIFPGLFLGYRNNDPFSFYWLADCINNINQNKDVWKKIDNKSPTELLKKCLETDPQNIEVKKKLFDITIEWLNYSQHEWPSGLLDGDIALSFETCIEIKKELKYLRSIDAEGKYEGFLQSYEQKLNLYMIRLSEKEF